MAAARGVVPRRLGGRSVATGPGKPVSGEVEFYLYFEPGGLFSLHARIPVRRRLHPACWAIGPLLTWKLPWVALHQFVNHAAAAGGLESFDVLAQVSAGVEWSPFVKHYPHRICDPPPGHHRSGTHTGCSA